MILLCTIFGAGLLHGLGPDHLAAITAFGSAVRHDFRRLVFFAVRFAGGHAVVLAIAGIAAHFGRELIPVLWERNFDLAAGGLLVLTGVVLLVLLATGNLSVHAHTHQHQGELHQHYHVHVASSDRHGHAHGSLAAALGALFALGGARSLLIVVPMAVAQTLGVSLLRVGAFVAGIAVAMIAYAFITQRAAATLTGSRFSESALFLKVSTVAVSVFCLLAGFLTLRERLVF